MCMYILVVVDYNYWLNKQKGVKMKNTKTKKLTFNESNLIAFILIEKMQYSKKELFVNNGQGFNDCSVGPAP